jgi:hypothetical protein
MTTPHDILNRIFLSGVSYTATARSVSVVCMRNLLSENNVTLK